jgi:hypothetical protein
LGRKWQLLHVAAPEIAFRRPPSRDREQRFGGIDARHLGAAGCGHLRRHAGAAADVQIARARRHARALQHYFEGGAERALLDVGPIGGACTPKPAVYFACARLELD